MTLKGQALANRLRGAVSFFSDTPPPGPVLENAREKLPAPEQSAQQSPSPDFNMSSPNLGSGPG